MEHGALHEDECHIELRDACLYVVKAAALNFKQEEVTA
jgi:hypothetical protein